MSTIANNICHPQVLKRSIDLSLVLYCGNECIFYLPELFLDKSMTNSSSFAHMR